MDPDFSRMDETGRYQWLFAFVTKATGSQFDENDADLWLGALKNYPFNDVYEATRNLILNSTEFVSVRSVRAAVIALRRRRIEAVGTPPVPPEEVDTPAQYQLWLRAWRHAVADGHVGNEAEVRAAAEIGGRPRAQIPRRHRAPVLMLPSSSQSE